MVKIKNKKLLAQILVMFLTSIILLTSIVFINFVSATESRFRELQTKQLFSVLVNEYGRIIDTSRTTLMEWSEDVVNDETYNNPCQSPITRLLDRNEKYTNYGFGDAKGNVVCSKVPFPEGDNLAVRVPEYNRVIEEKEFKVTDFAYGKSTGQARIAVGYPVINKSGDVLGVLFLSMKLTSINNHLNNYEYPPNAELLITDDMGTTLVVHPRNDEAIGKSTIDPRLFSIILSHKSGSIVMEGTDGIERRYTYSPYSIDEKGEVVSFILYGLPEVFPFAKYTSSIIYMQMGLLVLILILHGFMITKEEKVKKHSTKE